MAVDVWGNLYVTSSQGVRVFSPEGVAYGTIASPDQAPSNCTFGGPDSKTLVMTARGKVFAVTLQVQGLP